MEKWWVKRCCLINVYLKKKPTKQNHQKIISSYENMTSLYLCEFNILRKLYLNIFMDQDNISSRNHIFVSSREYVYQFNKSLSKQVELEQLFLQEEI